MPEARPLPAADSAILRHSAQHAQSLKYGLLAYLGAADITVFTIMRDNATTPRCSTEIDQTNRFSRNGAGWPRNACNRNGQIDRCMGQSAFRHFLRAFGADRTVDVDRRRRNAQHLLLGLVRIGDKAAI